MRTYKRLMDVFEKGELIRINETGEVFTYEASSGGANFSSYLTVNIAGTLVEWNRSLLIDDVTKVNKAGMVLNDFAEYAFRK